MRLDERVKRLEHVVKNKDFWQDNYLMICTKDENGRHLENNTLYKIKDFEFNLTSNADIFTITDDKDRMRVISISDILYVSIISYDKIYEQQEKEK